MFWVRMAIIKFKRSITETKKQNNIIYECDNLVGYNNILNYFWISSQIVLKIFILNWTH